MAPDPHSPISADAADAAGITIIPSPETIRRAITIDYTNWRGERAARTVIPFGHYFGSNKWHPREQWLMDAYDMARGDFRTFALAGIHGVIAAGTRPPVDAGDEPAESEASPPRGSVGAIRELSDSIPDDAWDDAEIAEMMAVKPPPTDSPGQRARVVMDVLCHTRRVPAEDLSRLPPGKPSADRYVFEPIEPVISDEAYTFKHAPTVYPGRVFFYRPNDPVQLGPPIEATYDHSGPGDCRLAIDGEPWFRVSCKVVFREEMWCVRWLVRREERP